MTNRTFQTPTLYLMAGIAGSGKTWVRKNDAAMMELPVVDADQFKASHPDYDPKNPSLIHAWSSKMAMRAFFEMLGEGNSFVYDGTGTSTEKYVSMINAAHAAGFMVEVVYVKVALATSLHRNANRERVVPEAIVLEQHSLIGVSMEILSGYADAYRVVRND